MERAMSNNLKENSTIRTTTKTVYKSILLHTNVGYMSSSRT
jgi:hypothetical protein